MSKFDSKTQNRPTLVITPGEPAGIGPDLALLLDPSDFNANLVLVADPDLLRDRGRQLGLATTELHEMDCDEDLVSNAINILPVRVAVKVTPGQLEPKNAAYVLQCLETAVSLCMSGVCHGLVTGPVHKANINEAGFRFTGHTEWLADRTGCGKVVMLLASRELRVALATTHLPLREVSDAISQEALVQILDIIHRDMNYRFSISRPKIMVCGLNPHAGEDGHMGMEEIETIIPAIDQARAKGIDVIGPVPADTAFTPAALVGIDVVLAMYHDQGLPVLKHQGFGEAVNVTLGLPIVRTSVDHGTALDLAGTGKAEAGSLNTAIHLAADMARRES